MRYVLTLLLLFAVPAWADADSEAKLEANAVCRAFVPSTFTKERQGGTTTVAFRVLPDGSVADVSVVTSSGQDTLDTAVRACVATWRYRPAKRQGQPVESRIQSDAGFYVGKSHVCLLSDQQWDKLKTLSGVARVRFTVTDDGHTANAKLGSSSGNKELDRATVDCVSAWRYLPAHKDDKPVAVSWEADIAWNNNVQQERISDTNACLREYPLKADELAGIDGTTELSYLIDHRGITGLQLVRSSGSKNLDNAALLCASREQYRETVHIGTNGAFSVKRRINWKTLPKPAP
jgi:TonB family protein